ncbi:hypothetical protein UFOVP257_209 [uncultured Caudovirales phage]|uniref:Uncharacterized protein n=1 Tax=uncultured Caudovirales phage TaxID=2100421 RepID=A0A6J5LH12_9CAUD|nr:hypothetical protein UFOVP257_209 [uncultured Caudovirales phage]
MNNLLMNCRPATVFNPENKEHRKAYYEFIKFSSWSRSPFQFVLEPGFEDIPHMCRIRLCEYYVNKEFHVAKPISKESLISVVRIPQKTI